MGKKKLTEATWYIGVDDHEIDLFEAQYVVPNGVSYNSYVILDEKVAIMDSVDAHKTEEWLANLRDALDGRSPDYLIISHMEPDHSGSLLAVAEAYPNLKFVGNAKTFKMFSQFHDYEIEDRKVEVKDGDCLCLGAHTLQFIFAPMVHWPEVMVTYDQREKTLFSADGFGKFGALDTEEDWACEARRYYFNIVGKYGAPVQTLLKKAAALDIARICPLHGPILSENLEYYIGKYQTWSSYEPEDEGVFIAYASIYGNTKAAAEKMQEILEAKGAKVAIADLARDDQAEAVEDAFRYSRMILAASSYDASVFPPMGQFLDHLSMKGYQKRKVGLVENGTWAPTAGRVMRASLEAMKDITVAEPVVTICSSMKETDLPQLEALAETILA